MECETSILISLIYFHGILVTLRKQEKMMAFSLDANYFAMSELASHADVLRLVTRDKPKNACVGGYVGIGIR